MFTLHRSLAHIRSLVAIALATFALLRPAIAGPVYNASENFSPTLNSSTRTWQYGWRTTLTGQINLFNPQDVTTRGTGIDFWVLNPDDATSIGHNGTNGDIHTPYSFTLKSNQMVMHPGGSGRIAVLLWKAPAAGRYTIHADWEGLGAGGGSPASTDAHVLLNGEALKDDQGADVFPKQIRGTGDKQSFTGTVTVAAGDRVEFTLDWGTSMGSPDNIADSTAINATISDALPSGEGTILYTRSNAGPRELVLMKGDGTSPTPLVDAALNAQAGTNVTPVQCALNWDASAVAYVEFTGVLFVMKPEPLSAGNLPVNLLFSSPVIANNASGIAWSPNGRQIAFQGTDLKLYVLQARDASGNFTPFDAATNPLYQVATSSSTAAHPAWSPDGRYLARCEGGYIHVFPVTNANGAIASEGANGVPLTLLSDSGTTKSRVAWNSDGRVIVFVETQPGQTPQSRVALVYVRDSNGTITPETPGNPRQALSAFSASPLITSVSWSADGTRLALSETTGGAPNVSAVRPSVIDGTNPRVPLTTSPQGGANAVFTQVLALPKPDFTLDTDVVTTLPYSGANPWTFKARLAPPLPASTTVKVQSSTDDTNWTDLPGGAMSNGGGTAQTWVATSSQVPYSTDLHFRVVAQAPGRLTAISDVQGPFPPGLPTPDFTASDIVTTEPYAAGNAWTFSAQISPRAPLPSDTKVVVQYSATPLDEASWQDVRGGRMSYSGSGLLWYVTTKGVPGGAAISFRVRITGGGLDPKASVDRGSFQIAPPPPLKPPTDLIVFVGGAKKTKGAQGTPFKFTLKDAANRLVDGLSVRIQYSRDGTTWLELPQGALSRDTSSAIPWALQTLRIPSGTIYFRAVSDAIGYAEGYGPATAAFTITAGPILDFALRCRSDSDPTGRTVRANETIHYYVTVTNYGEAAVQETRIKFAVPPLTNFKSSNGVYEPANPTSRNRIITLLDGTLEPNHETGRDVEVTVIDDADPGNKVENKTSTVKGLNSLSVVANPTTTTVLGPLELKLAASAVPASIPAVELTSARPGDFIDYTLAVKNSAALDFNNVRVTSVLPIGVTLVSIAKFNQGTGDFDGATDADPSATGNPAVTPYLPDGSLRRLTWTFPTLSAGEVRTMTYRVQMFYDLPAEEFDQKGVPHPLEIQHGDYNARGFLGTAKKESIAWPSAPPVSSVPLNFESFASPRYSFVKNSKGATPDAHINFGGEVGDVTTVLPGGTFSYQLSYKNYAALGAGLGDHVTIHDEIPLGAEFAGNLRLNDVPVTDFSNIKFYNEQGLNVQSAGEPFTDRNGDKKITAGEFTDLNGNRKFDGVGAIRSFDIDLGALGGGSEGVFTYDVKAVATAKDGGEINSYAGGLVPDLLKSTAAKKAQRGYLISSRNLRAPINGFPSALTVLVNQPVNAVKPPVLMVPQPSAAVPEPKLNEVHPGQQVRCFIEYRVDGGALLTLHDFFLTVALPNEFRVDSARFLNADGTVRAATPGAAGLGETEAVIGAPGQKGVRLIDFGLGNLPNGRVGYVEVDVTAPTDFPVDAAGKPGLVNALGQPLIPLFVLTQSGGQVDQPRPVAPHLAGGFHTLADSNPTITIKLNPQSSMAAMPPLGGSLRGVGKLFIGVGAPVSVQRNDLITYTVFYGNFGEGSANNCELAAQIPEGTTFVSASTVTNHIFNPQIPNNPQKTVRTEPARFQSNAGKLDTIFWDVLDLPAHSGGAVQFTVKVNGDFPHDTVTFHKAYLTARDGGKKPMNVGSGVSPCKPVTVQVRTSNPLVAFFESIGSFFSSLGKTLPSKANTAFEAQKGELTGPNARTYATGGTDLLHLTNGALVVPLLGNRVLVFGQPSVIGASDADVVANDGGGCVVAVGHSRTSSLLINNVRNGDGAVLGNYRPGELLDVLDIPASSIVAAGGGNIIAAGGGNILGQDAASLIGKNGAGLLGQDGASIVANDGAGFKGKVYLSARGIVAAGGGNILGQDAASFDGSTIVAAGGGNLIGQDGSSITLIATGGGGIVAAGGGNFDAALGKVVLARLLGQDGASIVAAGGGNIVAAGGGNLTAAAGITILSGDLHILFHNSAAPLTATAAGDLTVQEAKAAFGKAINIPVDAKSLKTVDAIRQ